MMMEGGGFPLLSGPAERARSPCRQTPGLTSVSHWHSCRGGLSRSMALCSAAAASPCPLVGLGLGLGLGLAVRPGLGRPLGLAVLLGRLLALELEQYSFVCPR